MRTTLTVFLKEVLDNFRDRRTLASALLMGPVFGPVLFAFVINLSIERSQWLAPSIRPPPWRPSRAADMMSFW